jgi:hypothetical protein
MVAPQGLVPLELHSLGWKAFQDLCLTIAREVLGQTVQAFADSNDGGRDGAFQGHWRGQANDELTGAFVLQCKFTQRRHHSLGLGDLDEELPKAQRLVAKGLCDSYLLLTNAKVSGRSEASIRRAFYDVGVARFVLWSAEWISGVVRENQRLRMLVPRLYGIGDLSQILDARAYDQAQALLQSMQDNLATFVVTDAYQRSARALEEHGFVLLIGEPMAGKTVISAALATASIDSWGCSPMKVDRPSSLVQRWNPHEPTQLFWVDDAFGTTQYQRLLAEQWNQAFPQVRAALRRGARVVMTSRDYIYAEARSDLKHHDLPLLHEQQVVVDVHALSLPEKQQILYNHAKLGHQPASFRRKVKPFLEDAAASPRFLPEVARRLGDPAFTGQLKLTADGIQAFFDHPQQVLLEVLRGLDQQYQAALALVFMHGGELPSPIRLQAATAALTRLGGTLAGCRTALAAMDGNLVRMVTTVGRPRWTFRHPSVMDSMALLVVGDPELLGIYLAGAPLDRLLAEVTCGSVELPGASVVVPTELFDLVAQRLDGAPSGWEAERQINAFLAHRCSREFLAFYLRRTPKLLKRLGSPGAYLNAVPDVPLVARLHALGLLPEATRRRFARTVADLAVEIPDPGFLTVTSVRAVLTDTERTAILERVRTEVLGDLGQLLDTWKYDYDYDPDRESPADYLYPLREALQAYAEAFSDAATRSAFDRAITGVDRLTEELEHRHMTDHVEREQQPRLSSAPSIQTSPTQRSIFEDVDT